MPVRTSAEYWEGLRDSREIWFAEERVPNVTTHPALQNGAHSLAQLYDLRHDPDLQEIMTYPSRTSGARMLAMLAPFSDEIAVYPSTFRGFQGEEHRNAMMFAILVATPGLKFICLEGFDLHCPLQPSQVALPEAFPPGHPCGACPAPGGPCCAARRTSAAVPCSRERR